MLPILVNERNIEPTVIKQANQFISFKFADIQLLYNMNFVGSATSLDSFLKAYKTSETKRFFPYEWFDHPDKIQNPEPPPYDAFYSKRRSCNPLETAYTDYVTILKSRLTTEQSVIKLKPSKPPPTGIKKYLYLQQIWKQQQMSSFKEFLRWYNNQVVLPTLEAMQKMIAFYHDNDIDMLKLGCTLPNLANICLHKSTDAKLHPFTEGDKDLMEKFRQDVVGGPSIVFTRKAVVDETFLRKSTNKSNSIIGIDASQLYPYSMCQPMLTGLYTSWDIDSETGRFTPRQNIPVASKIWSCLIFNVQDLIVKKRASTLQAGRRKLIAIVLMGFVPIVILCLKQWVDFTIFAPVKSFAHLSLKKISNVAVGEENLMNFVEAIYRRKVSLSLKCGNVSGGDFTRQPTM